MDLHHVTLALLAGGESSRMGTSKSSLVVRGRPILEYLFEQFSWPGPTLLVTAPGHEHPPGAERWDREAVDPVAGKGPLRGFLTALENSLTPLTLIAAVDMPVIGHDQLRALAEACDAKPEMPGAVFSHLGPDPRQAPIIEPLPCALRSDMREALERALRSGRPSLKHLIETAPIPALAAPIAWRAEIWMNLNYPADFAQFRTIVGEAM